MSQSNKCLYFDSTYSSSAPNQNVSDRQSPGQLASFGPLISWSSLVLSSMGQGFPPGASSSSQRLCSCDDVNNVVTSRCRECEEDLCDFCVTAHRRVKLTRSHKVVKVRIIIDLFYLFVKLIIHNFDTMEE